VSRWLWVTIAVCLCAAAPAAGATTWSLPSPVAAGDDFHALSMVAVPGRGLVAVAERGDGTAASWTSALPTTSWSALTLDPSLDTAGPVGNGCALTSLAATPQGAAMLMCASRASIVTSDLVAGAGGWSSAQTVWGVSPEQACSIQLAIAGDGTPVSAVSLLPSSNKEACGGAFATRAVGASSWSLTGAGADVVVSAGLDGSLVEAFVDTTPKQDPMVRVAVRRPGATAWGAPFTVARGREPDWAMGMLHTSISRSGDVAVGWVQGHDIDVATLLAGATNWSCRALRPRGRTTCIPPRGPKSSVARQPFRLLQDLAWAPSGRLVVLWQQGPTATGIGTLETASLARGARIFTTPTVLDERATTTSDEAFVPRSPVSTGLRTFGASLAVDGAGAVLAAWTRVAGAETPVHVRVARLAVGAARFARAVELHGGGSAEDLTLLAPSDGPTVVAWLDVGSIDATPLVSRAIG
jgi:hypothetical protein